MTDQIDRDAIIERIRKLFAMSQDVSSVHEAAIAARRCRSMMDKHGINEADLATSEFLSKEVAAYKKRPKWQSLLILGVARANDVIVESVRDGHRGVLRSSFHGFEQDVLLAELMYEYLIGAMDRFYKEFSQSTGQSGKAVHMSFNHGFACEMQKRLFEIADERKAELSEATGTSLVVVKSKLVAAEFGAQRMQRRAHNVSSVSGSRAGREAAKRVSLNTQMGSVKRTAIAG